MPTEVLVLSLSPGYQSVRDQERRGIGSILQNSVCAGNCCLCWQLLCGVHVRKEENGTGLTPTIANLSAGHVLDKNSASHPFVLLLVAKRVWSSACRRLLRKRSWEDCELVQRATCARFRTAGVAHINDLEDMSKAFTCTFRDNDEFCEKKTFLRSTCEPPTRWYE